MSFLNAALLSGALALAIPLIIHLFHKSRFKVVKWGAMHLLEAVIRQNQRRIRLEQWILLAVRCAIPVLLALTMARPLWKGATKLLGDVKTSTVVLLDNSYSMEASRAGTSNWKLARDEASRIIGDLKKDSEASLVMMGQGGAGLLDEPTYDTGRLLQVLNKSEAGFGAATVPAALDYASNMVQRMHEPVRQVVVLTDFQRQSFSSQEDGTLGEMISRLNKLPVPPSVTFFDIGQEIRENVAVESLEFSKLTVGVGQKVQIRANLRNFGENVWPDLRVTFRVDGKDKSAAQVKLGAHEKGQVLFTHAFDTPGSHVVEVSTEADALKADNSYLASIPVRDKLPVLLVNGDPSAEPLKGETDFAEIALQPYAAGKVELADLIQPKVVNTDGLNAKALADAAVVVMANVRRLSDDQLKALDDFVKSGGGLMIFPGSKLDNNWYDGPLSHEGKGLLPLGFGKLSGDAKEGAPTVGIVSQRFDNAALELFNDPRNGSMSDVGVRLWYKMKDPAGDTAGVDAPQVLARLDSGDPFLVEKKYGEGRVISCATALDADWSNLPMRPFYLPLMQRLTVYLASTIYPPRNLEVGKPLAAFVPVADVDKEANLTTPSGEIAKIKIVKRGDRGVIEYAKTQRPGLYTLQPPTGLPIHFVVNADRRESDLAKLTEKEITDLATAHGVTLVHSTAEYKQLEQKKRFGTELWKTLLWVLLAFLVGEMLLQQFFAGTRTKGSALNPVSPLREGAFAGGGAR